MSSRFALFCICLFLFSGTTIGQRYLESVQQTCRRSGKPVLMPDFNFFSLGLTMSPDIIGMDIDNGAGFKNGVVLSFGAVRYFNLDVNANQFGLGWNRQMSISANFWEDDILKEKQDIGFYPYFFFAAGVGPLVSLKLVDRLVLGLYANLYPALSLNAGFKYIEEGVKHREYSFIAANIGAQLGANLRYNRFVFGMDVVPAKSNYKIYSYIDGDAIEGSPYKRKTDVSRVNFTLGYLF